MLDRRYAVIAEEGGEDFLQNLAIRQHVGDAARYPEIVLQHGKASMRKPYQVGAADADVNPARHRQIAHFAPKVAATVYQFPRYDAIRQNFSAVVDVLEEQIQRRDSLGESTFNLSPFVVGNDSGVEIIWENTFRAFIIAVYGEGYSLVQKREVSSLWDLSNFYCGPTQ